MLATDIIPPRHNSSDRGFRLLGTTPKRVRPHILSPLLYAQHLILSKSQAWHSMPMLCILFFEAPFTYLFVEKDLVQGPVYLLSSPVRMLAGLSPSSSDQLRRKSPTICEEISPRISSFIYGWTCRAETTGMCLFCAPSLMYLDQKFGSMR